MRIAISIFVAVVAAMATLSLHFALAQKTALAGNIRDAEIEHTIGFYAAPLLKAAGLMPEDVKFHIVNDRGINAFVARGRRIFITSGLLMAADSPEQVAGVLAHEIGHITGGHLARLSGALNNARRQALIGEVIGFALGALAKESSVATTTIAKSSEIATKGVFKFSRTQERSADQFAVELLEKTQTSATGLLEFFESLQDQELLVRDRQDTYVATHPRTRDRIAFVRKHIEKSLYSGNYMPANVKVMHERMSAKLKGFFNPTIQTLREFPADDKTTSARYARAMAYYRNAQSEEALKLIDGLLEQIPNDPYFHEFRGQILFEHGKLTEALPSYERAVALLPQQPLLRVGLAHVQLELNMPLLIKAAISNLEEALRSDKVMPLSWQLAATAYGRDGQLGLSALALSEYHLLLGRYVDAHGQAEKAIRILRENSPGWVRAHDILNISRRASSMKRR